MLLDWGGEVRGGEGVSVLRVVQYECAEADTLCVQIRPGLIDDVADSVVIRQPNTVAPAQVFDADSSALVIGRAVELYVKGAIAWKLVVEVHCV